ncbi:cadherin-related family member 5 [Pseudorasbora parva]|uniref:cadherin-related family member 5 n=1 Tax=Pseudorasbora parva TaxID=51549 RepID=UPI00351E2A92
MNGTDLCSAGTLTAFKENNAPGAIVTTITAEEGVTARITSQNPEGLFGLDGYNLIAETVLDYETFDENNPYEVKVECTKVDSTPTSLILRIVVEDVNDNPPAFALSQYSLNVDEGEFDLLTDFNPNILVKEILDYDKVKVITMTLYAQDTPTGSTAEVSHTASTTIVVNIIDIDNRPPWFQPCSALPEFAQVCINSGYEGTVKLNVQEAYQKENANQFATTTVILNVVISSNHPPIFVNPSYEGFISEDAGVDSLVLESKTSNRPLRVQATDEDFSNGYNPNLKFEVVDGTEFSITPEGFILMAKAVSPGSVNLQMRVVDTDNDESSTASLTVEVMPGVPITTPGTTIMTSSIITTDHTANTQLTDITATSNPGANTTTTRSPGGQQGKAGEYSTEEMAAVGASLAVVVVLCLVCIGLMAHRIKGHNTDWKKLSEASIFRSTLGGGSGDPKKGMQYSNEGFQHDGDSGSINSNLAADLENKLESGLQPQQRSVPAQENMTPRAASVLHSTAPDSSSLADSETVDGEKEVKPILTKERRTEDGYKAVWFKEDIDPNTKEDVVIIPDTSEADGDHEEEDNSEDGDSLRTDMDSEDEEI